MSRDHFICPVKQSINYYHFLEPSWEHYNFLCTLPRRQKTDLAIILLYFISLWWWYNNNNNKARMGHHHPALYNSGRPIIPRFSHQLIASPRVDFVRVCVVAKFASEPPQVHPVPVYRYSLSVLRCTYSIAGGGSSVGRFLDILCHHIKLWTEFKE